MKEDVFLPPIAEGGGISINAFTNLEMESVIVTNNSATTGGGVAAVDQSILSVTSSYFEHNRASDGGGIGVLDAVEFSCFESTFVNNKALFRGGGIYTTHSNCPINETGWKLCITLSDIVYTNNEAVSGGGFYWKFVNSTKGSLVTYDQHIISNKQNCQKRKQPNVIVMRQEVNLLKKVRNFGVRIRMVIMVANAM